MEHCGGQQMLSGLCSFMHVRKFYEHGEIIAEDKQQMMREKIQCNILVLVQ
jgi:hypothetical protein